MASPAVHLRMLPAERKSRLVVVKPRRIPADLPARRPGIHRPLVFPGFRRYLPARRRVAIGAVHLEGGSVRRLSVQFGRQPQDQYEPQVFIHPCPFNYVAFNFLSGGNLSTPYYYKNNRALPGGGYLFADSYDKSYN